MRLQPLTTRGHFGIKVLLLSKMIEKFTNFEQILKRNGGHDLNINQSSYITYTRPNVSFHNKKYGLSLIAASEEPQNQAKGDEDK